MVFCKRQVGLVCKSPFTETGRKPGCAEQYGKAGTTIPADAYYLAMENEKRLYVMADVRWLKKSTKRNRIFFLTGYWYIHYVFVHS